jgi:hypothetical protein
MDKDRNISTVGKIIERDEIVIQNNLYYARAHTRLIN